MGTKGFWAALAAVSVLSACGDTGIAPEPSTAPNIDSGRRHPELSLATDRYSAWSDPVNLGPVVNSSLSDQQPALSKNGLSLYFASDRPDPSDNVREQNIWVARRACTDGCPWTEPVALGPAVNGPFLDASPTLSRDEHQLFFTSQRPHEHCSSTENPCNRDLWVSYRDDAHDDFGWQPAVNLPGEVNSSAEELAPSYFENGEAGLPQLFFNDGQTVNGVLTGGDIYMSEMQADGSWGEPSSVEEINTNDFSDQRPSIAHDGLEIYFWSSRDGVAHIWRATRERVSDPWLAPTRVPSPISDAASIQPFIHAHGRTETLLLVRTVPNKGNDLFMSQRSRDR